MASIHITARTMNPGTKRAFVRVFVTCPMGHDLGSVPLDYLKARDAAGHLGVEFDSVCNHHEHRTEGVT